MRFYPPPSGAGQDVDALLQTLIEEYLLDEPSLIKQMRGFLETEGLEAAKANLEKNGVGYSVAQVRASRRMMTTPFVLRR